MRTASTIEIDLTAIDHNLRVLRRLTGDGVAICPVVKADAYGLGAAKLGRRLQKAGADMLAVYQPQEAAELFASGVTLPVLVLMPMEQVHPGDELEAALQHGRLHISIHSERQLRRVMAQAERVGRPIPVHLELDTGMSRGGCAMPEASKVLKAIANAPRLVLAGVYTHFARARSADTFTDEQRLAFERFVAAHRALIPPTCRLHLANTAATIRGTRFHQSMIRVGIAWMGYGPELQETAEQMPGVEALRPIVRWRSRVVHVKIIEPGTPVGYGSPWVASRRTVLGLVPVGYADGYPAKLASTEAQPLPALLGVGRDGLGDQPRADAPVVGALSMDQLTVDLTDCIAELNDETSAGEWCSAMVEAAEGLRVEMITPERAAPNHLPKLAKQAEIPAHELLCRLHPNVPRVYLAKPPAVVETLGESGVVRAG